MEKKNLFFTSLKKKNHKKNIRENEVNSTNKKSERKDEQLKTDNEWLQEYELIYRSYSIDGY